MKTPNYEFAYSLAMGAPRRSAKSFVKFGKFQYGATTMESPGVNLADRVRRFVLL